MRLKQIKTISVIIACFLPQFIFSQIRFSLATDISLERSFKKDQRFWAFGQNVILNWHLTQKNGLYASLCYYSNGNFKNSLSASAKSSSTSPQDIFFVNRAQLRLIQISFGWKYYVVGTNDAESKWNLYTISGFGLIFGQASNIYSLSVDTSLYNLPQQPVNGAGHFKRLTIDLGLGWEIPIGGDLYFYSEAKMWIPTTDYPSKYLFINNNAPLVGTVSAGLRISF
ncbi:MAG TPA: hypothetical protein VGI82_00760 [Chitinophagaceae bacterium]